MAKVIYILGPILLAAAVLTVYLWATRPRNERVVDKHVERFFNGDWRL